MKVENKRMRIVFLSVFLLFGLLTPAAHADTQSFSDPLGDTYVDENVPNTNFSSATKMFVGKRNLKWNKSYIKFDLSPQFGTVPLKGLPGGSHINSATLNLYCLDDFTSGATAYMVIGQDWNENELTYTNQREYVEPGDYFDGSANQNWTFDVTEHVRSWIEGGDPNYGFALVANEGDNNYVSFATENNGSHIPSLMVSYTLPSLSYTQTPLPETVTVGEEVTIRASIRNNGSYPIKKVWFALDILAPGGTKVENTQTPIPDPETGHIGAIVFSPQNSNLAVGETREFTATYTFSTSVTGHNYAPGTYTYIYKAWANGYPGSTGAIPITDLQTKTFTIQQPPTGNLQIEVRNAVDSNSDGQLDLKPGAVVKLYNSDGTHISDKQTLQDGKTSAWANLSLGSYYIMVYYPSPTGYTEYWGKLSCNVTAGTGDDLVGFVRNMPYVSKADKLYDRCYELWKNAGEPANWSPNASINFARGGKIFFKVEVKNPNSGNKTIAALKIRMRNGANYKEAYFLPSNSEIPSGQTKNFYVSWSIANDTAFGKWEITPVVYTLDSETEGDGTTDSWDYDSQRAFNIIDTVNKPPVILVHGICETPGVFGMLESLLEEEGFIAESIYYKSTNNLSDPGNGNKTMHDVAAELNSFVSVYGKVDIVSHSMGGLVTRAYRAGLDLDEQGRTSQVLQERRNKIGKFIMIGTPNFGSDRFDLGLHEFLWQHTGEHADATLFNQLNWATDLVWIVNLKDEPEPSDDFVIAGTYDRVAGGDFESGNDTAVWIQTANPQKNNVEIGTPALKVVYVEYAHIRELGSPFTLGESYIEPLSGSTDPREHKSWPVIINFLKGLQVIPYSWPDPIGHNKYTKGSIILGAVDSSANPIQVNVDKADDYMGDFLQENEESHIWYKPDLPARSYSIKVTKKDGTGEKLISTNVVAGRTTFLIADYTLGTIQVTSSIPNVPFAITYTPDYGLPSPFPESGNTGITGTWTKSDASAGTYAITWGDLAGYTKPSSESKKLAYDTQDKKIAFYGEYIAQPTITVNSPNGGETWTVGSQATVTWTHTGSVGNVNIKLSTNGGSTFPITFVSNTANDHTETFTVPNNTSTTCRVKVEETDGSPNGVSTANFTIAAQPPQPTITVNSPNGGETWTVGNQATVTWAHTGSVGNVNIKLSTNSGSTFPITLVSNTANDHTETFTVPNNTSTTCRVRVEETDGSPNGVSTANFTIAAQPPSIAVTVTTSIGAGTTVKVDGTNRNAPYNTTWDSGSGHTLDIDSPQTPLLTKQYIFSSWSDGLPQSHPVSPNTNTNYIATLLTQWKPTVLLLGTDSSHTVNVTYTQKGVVLRDFGIKSSWSDWCDSGSTLTFSQTTTGTPPKVTTDTCSWTVNSAFSNNIQYVTSDFEFNPVPSPGSRTIVQGGSTDYTVSLKSLGGYNSPVYLSVSNILPWPGSGDPITCSFSQSPVTPQDPSATATLNINTSQSVIPQTYTLTIQGQDGAYIKNTSVALTVNSSPLNGSISGRIFKQEAVQVVLANAYVRAVEEFAPWSERAFDYSDPQGVYNLIGLTPGLYTVYAKREDYGTAIKLHVPVNAGQDTPNQDLYVSIDPGRISGSVKNSSQQALGNVRVQLSVAEADGHNYYTGTYDDTLQTGNYELLDLSPRNDYQIRLGGITVNSVDYAGETRSNISVQSGQYKTENFILHPAAKIFGWVKDSQGNLIKDTRIETWVDNDNVYSTQDTTTDSNGNYKDYSLRYLPAGHIFTVEVTPPGSSNFAMQRFEVNVPSSGDYERNITLLSNAIKISGKVTDKTTHQAIANIRVTYWNTEKRVWQETLTDKDGNYRFTNLPPGEARVTVKPTSSYACDAVKKDFQSDDTVDFALYPEATLTGVVKDFYTKQPVLKSMMIDYWSGQDQSISMQTYTDPASGTFTLGGIPKGLAEIMVCPDISTGYAWTVNYLYFTEGEHKSGAVFYLKKGALISGSVKGPDDSPKAGVEIDVYGPLAPGILGDCWADSDTNGEFKLRLAPGSPVTYGASIPGWADVNWLGLPKWVGLPKEITINNHTDDQSIILTAYDSTNAGYISGQIVGNYPKTSEFHVGAFLAGAALDKDTLKYRRPIMTDLLQSPGPYELMVPPGNNYDLYLLVYDSGDGGMVNSITLRDKFPTSVPAGSTGKNLYYNSVGGTVTGQVTYNGQPVLMATVYLEDFSGNLKGFADTNQNGVYHLYNVPAGNYVVNAWYPDYGTSQDFSANGVTDNGTITANIIIGDTTNHPPVLYPIGDKTVNRREVLSFALKAIDPDGDKICYEISGTPQGASCNTESGNFLWRPEIWQAGEFPVTFIARDTQGNQDSESITISVPNAAPVLYPIGNKTVKPGRYFMLKLGATDSDSIDQGSLKYYAENLPRGAAFNSATGTFQWRPYPSQRGSYSVIFSVSDPPGATDTEAITITVQ